MRVEGRRLHPRDPGYILPVVPGKLPEDVIVAQVDEPHLRLPLLVQRAPHQPGNRLRRQRLAVPVREHHRLGGAVALPAQRLQPIGQLLLQRHLPIRQHNAPVLKVNLRPGEGLDLLPQQARLPRKTQNRPHRVVRILL